jgi:hypothetical protein
MFDNMDIKINQTYYKAGIENVYYFSRLFARQWACHQKDIEN